MSTFATLLMFFSIYGIVIPLFKLLLDIADRRYRDSKGVGHTMNYTPGPNGFVLRSAYYSLLASFFGICATAISINENWMYESAVDGNQPFPYWWLILTVAIAGCIGGNAYVFCYRKFVADSSPPTNA